MRGKPLTLQRAMELCYYNDPQWTAIIRDWEGQYAVTRPARDFPQDLVFATREQVRAAIQEASGDYFRAGQELTQAYEERQRAVIAGQPDTTTPEC